MTLGKAFSTTSRSCFVLLGAGLIAVGIASKSFAQAQQPNPFDSLTVENLISDAVSLSNQEYPEIEKAIQRFKNNDAQATQEFLKNAEKKYPKLPPAQVLFAKMNLLIRTGLPANQAQQVLQVAMFWLNKAAAEVPDDPEAYLILADLAFSTQRTTDAQALFEYAAPLVEKYDTNTKRKQKFQVRVLAGRAAIAQRRAHWEEASKWLQQWIASDPESAVAYQRYGVVLYNLDKPQEALKEFTTARELDTSDQIMHPQVSMAQLHAAEEKVEEARKAFEIAFNEDQSNEKTAQAFVNWLLQQDDLKQAQKIIKTLRKQKPALQGAIMLDGFTDIMQGNREAAISTMNEILDLNPSNSRATDLLALLLIESEDANDKQKALSYAQINAQRFANNAQANVTLAWVLYRLGRKADAQQLLTRIRNQSANLSQDALYLIARIFVENGNSEQAIKTLETQLAKKSANLFLFRRDAEKLLAELKAG